MLRAAGSFVGGLRSFLANPVRAAGAAPYLESRHAARTTSFSGMLARHVFRNPGSPYRALFDMARISETDVTGMLTTVGLEGTLERLHDAGIFVTLEEFKGFRPISRGSVTIPCTAADFDNPLDSGSYEAATGGSRGTPRRIVVGLDILGHEASYHAGFYELHGGLQRPVSMWLPAPPGAVGIKNALIRAKLGVPVQKWFSQNRFGDAPFRHSAFAGVAAISAKLWGSRIPWPEYTPIHEVGRVTAWLAARRAGKGAGVLLTTPSAAVRTCNDAAARGADITGSLFVVVGEPLTRAKTEIIDAAGCSVASHYAMVEAGMIGLACASPAERDDVHIVSDKIAVIQRDRPLGTAGQTVSALLLTTLHAGSSKLMINVESGDSGTLEHRDCGCGVLPRPFSTHLHTLRSYEKLTSEGMHFIGMDLLTLLEEVLPARFGGSPGDYQMVEREMRGIASVELVVHPSVGALDERNVLDVAYSFLRSRGQGQRLMADIWSRGHTLRLVRREPSVTAAGKILALSRSEG